MTGWVELAAAIIIVAATAVLTLAVLGILRIPDTYVKVHATSTAVAVGPLLILVATLPSGDWALIIRAVLVGGFLIATTPVSAHALVRLEKQRREKGIDEEERP